MCFFCGNNSDDHGVYWFLPYLPIFLIVIAYYIKKLKDGEETMDKIEDTVHADE